MSYGTISRKSSGKGKSVLLPMGLCILFFAVYFSFLFFFRFTQSIAFFQYLALLFIVSVLVSLVYSFINKKAWIPLALQIIFGIICAVNYSSYRSDMQYQQSEMEKQLKYSQLKAETAEREFYLLNPDLTRGDKAKAVLIRMDVKPLLMSEQNWRCQATSLSEIQFSNNLQCPDDHFFDGQAGWTGSISVVSGCYFGLFYEILFRPLIDMPRGSVTPDSGSDDNLVITNRDIISFGDALSQSTSSVDKKITNPGEKKLSFSIKLSLLPNKSSRKQSFASATWKYVPALAPVQKKKKLEFR